MFPTSFPTPALSGAAVAGSIALTARSAPSMVVTPSAPGQYATLHLGLPQGSIYNAGDYDYGIKDPSGTQLGWVRARCGATFALTDATATGGSWALTGVEKLGVTASYSNATLANTGNYVKRVALDTNRMCFVFGGTSIYAIVYDASTQTWGTATLVRSGIAASGFACVLSATNQVLVCSYDSTTGMQTVTLSISVNTVTVNTPVSTTLAGNIFSVGQLVAVPAQSAFVIAYSRSAPANCVRAITVSGTVPTISAELSLFGGSNIVPSLFVSGSVVRTVYVVSTTLYANPVTISGSSTPVAGSYATVATTSTTFRAFLNGNGNIVAHYLNTTDYAAVFSLSGTTETGTSVNLGTSTAVITTGADYVQVSASKTAFVSCVSTTMYANILTDTAGTASAGTEITMAVTSGAVPTAIAASGNSARFCLGTSAQSILVSLDCSGASPTVSSMLGLGYSGSGVAYSNGPSDAYGVRYPSNLIANGSLYSLAANVSTFDRRVTANSIGRLTPVPIPFGNAYYGAVGSTTSDSFIGNVPPAGTTGYTITRVEAAA